MSFAIAKTGDRQDNNIRCTPHPVSRSLQVARYTASRPERKETLDVLEAGFLKLLEGAKPTAEVSPCHSPRLALPRLAFTYPGLFHALARGVREEKNYCSFSAQCPVL